MARIVGRYVGMELRWQMPCVSTILYNSHYNLILHDHKVATKYLKKEKNYFFVCLFVCLFLF